MKHLAIVMDGNRRWARKQGLQVFLGHSQGVEAVQRTAQFCLDKGIPFLSLYTFSLENFKRASDEVAYLFNLLATKMRETLPQFIEKKIRVRFIGDRSFFPAALLPVINEVEQKTEQGTALQINFLFCYGGRQEIISGIKAFMQTVAAGLFKQEQLDEELFKDFLWTKGVPEPELIIRTGGHRRLSNFLLYQAAYSELYFLDCLWPELDHHHLDQALAHYDQCQRNFGA